MVPLLFVKRIAVNRCPPNFRAFHALRWCVSVMGCDGLGSTIQLTTIVPARGFPFNTESYGRQIGSSQARPLVYEERSPEYKMAAGGCDDSFVSPIFILVGNGLTMYSYYPYRTSSFTVCLFHFCNSFLTIFYQTLLKA